MAINNSSIVTLKFWQKVLGIISKIGVKPEDNDETRLQVFICVVTAVIICVAGAIWGFIYFLLGEFYAGLIPLSYVFITIISLLFLRKYKIFKIFHFSQTFMILVLPFLLMAVLGGLINGSAVIIWAIFAPISALLSGPLRKAVYWFLAYIGLVILSGFIQPYLRTDNELSTGAILLFFILNVATVSLTNFLILNYFVGQKNKVIDLMRKNRELEQSYLQQEVMLHHSEKLATLGRLSAGMAHELNNPASVALRGAKQLKDITLNLEKLMFGLGRMNLSEDQLENFNNYKEEILIKTKKLTELDPLVRSDRETEIEKWLENNDISEIMDISSMMVNLNLPMDDLIKLKENYSEKQFPAIISSLHIIYIVHNLLEEIGEGTGRITEIVRSLKSYSHLDEAPIQSVDIHEGLNDTLVMLRSQLKGGITVQKNFDKNLPSIMAYGSELNQVWTNIIDNSISAMKGKGTITIKTFKGDQCLVIQIKDDGPGIPEDLIGKVFDPFFTTKLPGEGTGLGLNISHNIIVQKHKGKISVNSGPEGTCFEIKLPLDYHEAKI